MIVHLLLFTTLVFLQDVNCTRITQKDENSQCITPASQPGTCVHIKKCPELMNLLLTQKYNPDSFLYLNSSVCYYDNVQPIVCCPNEKANLFPGTDVCGLSKIKQNRVVGGLPAALGSWPWIAALGYTTAQNTTTEWLCGGTLITDRYVLTAAHCVLIRGKILTSVRLGELDLAKTDEGAVPVDYLVDKIVAHECFSVARRSSDIALARLNSRVVFTDLIRPICLPFSNALRSKSFTGYTPFIAGWGSEKFEGPKSSVLLEAQLEVTDLEQCMFFYLNLTTAIIDQKVLCAESLGRDSCRGDSGGPLMLPRGKNFYLIGIISHGYKCAEPGYPGVYTRVTEFLDWIESNVVNI